MAKKIDKPNILLILVDDMGYGDFSRFNDGLSQTPRLDALIDESVCFSQSYTASPVCNPSRAALLTGRYPHRTGSIDTLEWRGLERLALGETTLADVLKSEGYATGLIGKWHLGAYDMRYHPNSRGFDEAVCFRGGMHDYYRWRLEYNDKVRFSDGRYLTDLWADEAEDFISRHRAEPFFLHLTFNAPHTPLQAPGQDIRPFLEKNQFTKGVSILYGMLRRLDAGVARVLETLRKNGLEENTIVLFSSDNGPQFGGEGELRLNRFNCGFNGAKGSVYEGGIRVPMLIRWPAELEGGTEVREMVHFCDWFPTVLEMAGVTPPRWLHPLDGSSVLPLIRSGSPDDSRPPTKRFWQWNRYTPMVTCNAAMRNGEWKLVRPAVDQAMQVPQDDIKWLWVSMYGPEHFLQQGLVSDPEPQREVPAPSDPELYNIEKDPLEQNNLFASQPARAAKMLAELESWFEEVDAERRAIPDEW
jgi:arylsulfatase A